MALVRPQIRRNDASGWLVCESFLGGLEKFPVGRERCQECEARRKDVRRALRHMQELLVDLARSVASFRLQRCDSLKSCDPLNDADEYALLKSRLHSIVSRCTDLASALSKIQALDTTSRETFSEKAKDREIMLTEYMMLFAEIESDQAYAVRLMHDLDGSYRHWVTESALQVLLMLASPIRGVMAMGQSLQSIAVCTSCRRDAQSGQPHRQALKL
mmetsp:Transcript_52942/g.123969  ORF Transcript_52942/g.123969 Transcript_52942/m.123969 type:complete len:216 (-) Transcript_52942:38-685(-)